MAERRMFSKKIVDSDAFKTMSLAAQALYFHLGMAADDDGVVNNAVSITRSIGATQEALEELVSSRRFLLKGPNGVYVVKHWKINNVVRADRYVKTTYSDVLENLEVKEDGAYTEKQKSTDNGIQSDNQVTTNCQPSDNQMSENGCIGKDRLGKDNISISPKVDILVASGEADEPNPEKKAINYSEIQTLYNKICVHLSKCTKLSEGRKANIRARIAEGYTVEDFKKAFEKAEASDFLTGKTKVMFVADFDFIFTRSKLPRILEGFYDNKKPVAQKRVDLSDIKVEDLQGGEVPF